MNNVTKLTQDAGVMHFEYSGVNGGDVIINLDFFDEMLTKAIEFLSSNSSKGIIFEFSSSAKGIEYSELLNEAKAWQVFTDRLTTISRRIFRLKSFEKPIISIIHKDCFDAACSFVSFSTYVFLDSEKGKLGFPASKYGLMPGFTGTVNTLLRIGATKALSVLTNGKRYGASECLSLGLIDKEFKEPNEAVSIAYQSIEERSRGNCTPAVHSSIEENDFVANLVTQINRLIPGQLAIAQVFQEVVDESVESAYEIEADAFSQVLLRAEVKAMLRTSFYGVRNAKKVTENFPKFPFSKISVIGAGMMGAGIAYESARNGLQVILKDVSIENAERGRQYSGKVQDKLISRGLSTTQIKESILNRITSSEQLSDIKDSDIIIEAVFEDTKLKQCVIRESAGLLNDNGFFASNTTSLPISMLSSSSADATRFIGLHFFSPVDRMPLVEVIVGQNTSKDTLEKALSFVSKLNKVPIVVHDGHAFFTSRIFFNYLLEGISMIQEGIPLEQVDGAARLAGFAVGPLAVLDEISLDLMVKVYEQLPILISRQYEVMQYLRKLISLGRSGRRAGKGFYDYPENGSKKTYWQDPDISLSKEIPCTQVLKDRLLNIVALDSFRCLNEGILDKPIDGDIGSIFGLGYPQHTGGVFSYIDLIGIEKFVKDCKGFEEFGEQWIVPESLEELAKVKHTFYSDQDF